MRATKSFCDLTIGIFFQLEKVPQTYASLACPEYCTAAVQQLSPSAKMSCLRILFLNILLDQIIESLLSARIRKIWWPCTSVFQRKIGKKGTPGKYRDRCCGSRSGEFVIKWPFGLGYLLPVFMEDSKKILMTYFPSLDVFVIVFNGHKNVQVGSGFDRTCY
jgi:hypothetical protein